jgi:putative restriction endonuclease
VNDRHETDSAVRVAAFAFLDGLRLAHGDRLPREELVRGFDFRGQRVPLVGPQGIFKPAVVDRIPLSITTAPIKEGRPRPYEDELRDDGLIGYKYRGTDPNHHENVGLREAMRLQAPLVYLFGLSPGWYVAAYPVFVVGDDPQHLSFTLAVDDIRQISQTPVMGVHEEAAAVRREYVTRSTQQRLHQRSFRERVLRAYELSCAVCRLKHEKLLEAAHILPDGHPRGEPWVSNGLALCKLHHAAYDENILGIRADYVVEIREDILREKDGPMLTHGLQDLHGKLLMKLPRSNARRPRAEFLEMRYQEFRTAG